MYKMFELTCKSLHLDIVSIHIILFRAYQTSYEMPPPPDLYSSTLAPPTSASTVCSMPQSYK